MFLGLLSRGSRFPRSYLPSYLQPGREHRANLVKPTNDSRQSSDKGVQTFPSEGGEALTTELLIVIAMMIMMTRMITPQTQEPSLTSRPRGVGPWGGGSW
jgi:hypothetical protein